MLKHLLTDAGEFTVDALGGLELDADDMLRATGWCVKPEGLCRDDVCVPAPHVLRGDRVDAAAFWQLLGQPVVHDEAGEAWVLGAGADARRHALASLASPDFELPDVNGVVRRLSALRGRKVFLATWAPWCGCRTDLPVWQALFDELKDEPFMVVAVAEESRGVERVRPWVDATGAGYWCLVDTEHRVGDLFGLVNVPQAVWIDEHGRIVRPPENPGWTDEWRHNAGALLGMSAEQRKARGFMSPAQSQARDAGRRAYMQAVKDWVRTGRHALAQGEARRALPPITPAIVEAQARFRLGLWLHAHGKPAEGERRLAEASRLHPESWTIWRQAAELEEIGRAAGPAFLARMAALGDKPYYPAPDLPGFARRSQRRASFNSRLPMTSKSSTSNANAFVRARDFLLLYREDYDVAYRDFRWPSLDRFNWALDYFDAMAEGNPAPALHIVGEDGSEVKRSFDEMSRRSSQVANHLRTLGVKRGDRILLMLGNELALWEVMLAAIKLGAVLIPATSLLTTEDLADRLDRGAVRHVITASAQAPKFAPLPGDYTRVSIGEAVPGWQRLEDSASAPFAFEPDGVTLASDPMLLYFTSGTTSLPKLVLHSHQSYPVGHLSTMYWIGLKPGDIHLNISSPGWAKHAWSCFFAPWNAGACIFIFNYARFNAQGLLKALQTHRVTSLCAPPTVWRMLIQEDLGAYRGRLSLREVIGAGEPLNPEIIEQVREAWGLTLRDGYGQTETTAQIGNPPGQPVKPGSMGKPLPGYRIVLLDADGRPAEEGEVCLDLAHRPRGLMVGYEDSAEKTSEAMRDGHYHTGDVAARDADGCITFVGRADDVFKASDYRISPFELESALIEHESIAEVAIVPCPDPLRLAVPKAYLILTAGAVAGPQLAEAIFVFARQRLAPYKRVRRIEFVDELPKTISGKIRRVQLRAQEIDRHAAGTRGPGEFFEDDFAGLRKPAEG